MGPDGVMWMLVFLRASGFLIVLPLFSATNLPQVLRVALAAFLAFLISPFLPPFAVRPTGIADWIGLFLVETTAGLVVGFVTRMVFYVCDFAGRLITNELGLNSASVFNPAAGESSQAPGMILFYFSITVLMSMDLHHWVLLGFRDTYTVLPIGTAHLGGALLDNLIGQTSRMLAVGVLMAAPVMAGSFIVTLVFSVLGRIVPQMSAFLESFSVRAIGGLVVFGLSLDIMAQHLLNYLTRLPDDILRVAQFLAAR
jgi:flagellar biosynthetic protein FliR